MDVSVIVLDSDVEASSLSAQNHDLSAVVLDDEDVKQVRNEDNDDDNDGIFNTFVPTRPIVRKNNPWPGFLKADIVEIGDDDNDNDNEVNNNNCHDNNNNIPLRVNDINSSFHSDIICVDDDDDDGNDDNDIIVSRPTNRLANLNIYPSSPQQNPSSSSLSIHESISSIVLDSIPSPFPELKLSKRYSTNVELSSSQHKKPKLAERSSSIGSITLPKTKPKTIARSSTVLDNQLVTEQYFFQTQNQNFVNLDDHTKEECTTFTTSVSKNTTRSNSTITTRANTVQTSRSSTNSYMDRPSKNLLSDITDINSSFDDISKDSLHLDDEIHKIRREMEAQRKERSKNVKNLISDLNNLRNNQTNDTSEIINSSLENIAFKPRNRFMDGVTDDINVFSNEKLDELLQRANDIDSENLKLVNKAKYSKDELIEQITGLFSSILNEKFTILNENYMDLFKPLKIEIDQDESSPVIKFKRFTKAVFYEKKKIFVPIKPRFINEDHYLLVYQSAEILDLFYKGILKKNINSIKRNNSNANISVWIVGFDVFLKNLKNKVQRLSVENVRGNLEDDDHDSNSKKKKDINLENLVHPEHIRQKILKYEVDFDIKFQKFSGLLELSEWLISFCYTLSSKHFDHLERNQKYSNIGKIKSSNNPKDCIVQMISQLKGVTEQRAKAFVEKNQYNCVGDLFNDVKIGTDFKANGSLRSDHEKILQRLFLSKNADDLI